nr:flavodoxin domain-containing protein [Caldilineaceae bacterium]
MNKRILVTYATRAGSTAEVASAIGETLAARGFVVEVKPIKEKPPVEGYDGVLIGSAIRIGQWLPEAVDFIKRNQTALNHVPVALFTVHLNNLGDDEESQHNRLAYLDSVRPLLHATDEAFFAGKLEYARLTWFERL